MDMKPLDLLLSTIMKIVVRVADMVGLVRRFEESPAQAMRELVGQAKNAVKETLERVMDAEIELFLGEEADAQNKRNGYVSRTFGIKGLGVVSLKVPSDRKGKYQTQIVPPHRRYDEATEKDIAMLNLSGMSTRLLSQLSRQILGIQISPQEVTNSLHSIIPAAKRFLERRLDDRKWMYLYVDGTNFYVRRSTIEREPTLVVLGVDEEGHKSVLAMIQGDKDNKRAWEAVFADLVSRGLDKTAVKLGIMDGLPGLPEAFLDAFPKAKIGRCWVHKYRNIIIRVPKRYQKAFDSDWDKIQYAAHRKAALEAFGCLRERWQKDVGDAVASIEKDLEELLVHYDFPKEHWTALRTTNPIERVHKEFKRRSKAMDTVGPDTLKVLLAFTAIKLEFGWLQTPITSSKLNNLKSSHIPKSLNMVESTLLQ